MKRTFYSLLFVLLLSVACGKQEESVPVVIFQETGETGHLIQQVESIQLIPLENDGHYYGWSSDLLLLDDGFLVVDKDNCQVIRYDSRGKYVNRIGEQGNGPGEYPDIYNVQLSGDNILIFSSPGATSHCFGFGGAYLGKEYMEMGGQQFAVVPEGVLGFNGYGMPEKCKVSLCQNGESKNFYPYSSDIIAFGDFNNVFSFDGGQVFVRDQLDPVIYYYQSGTMKPRISFDFGKYAIEENFYSMDYMASATYLMEKDLCLLSRYMESGTLRLVEVTRPLERRSYYGLYTGGQWVWSDMGVEEKDPFASAIKALDGNALYALVNPALLKQLPPLWHSVLSNPEILDNITEEDNYVVVRMVLKK